MIWPPKYNAAPANNSRPSVRVSFKSNTNSMNAAVARIMTPQCTRNSRHDMATGATRAVKPSASPRLATFDPNTFPMAMDPSPRHAACREANSSGAEVPIATMVKPTTSGETLALSREGRGILDQQISSYNEGDKPANEPKPNHASWVVLL